MNDNLDLGPPGDPCAECGQPTYPARDGVYDDIICQPCNDRLEAELDANWAAMSDEEKADCERAAARITEKALAMIREADERRRLAESRFSPECNKFVARTLHDQGVEVTPDQVAEARDSGLAKIRAALTERGWELPADDVGLMAMMQDVFKKGNDFV